MKRWGYTVLTALLVSGASPVMASPPHPELAREIREGRRSLPDYLRQLKEAGPPKLRGDRQVRKILRELKRQRTGDSGVQSLPAPGAVTFDADAAVTSPAPPARGTANVLTLLASFTDVLPWESPGYFDNLVFGFDGSEYGAVGPSVSHYYREVSADSFTVVTEHPPSSIQCTPDVGPCTAATPPGWIPLPQTKAVYREDLRAMLADAIAASDAAVDFSRYDSDGDGLVDYLILVHAGSGGEFTGDNSDVWSQAVNLATPVVTGDGVSVNTFITVPEYWFSTQFGRMTIGVYVHEFAHLLGLPDLYDISTDSKGIGDWGLMGLGVWNGASNRGESPSWLSAWSRVALGWVVPEAPLSDLAGVVLPPVEQAGPGRGGPVYYLWDHGNDNSEFFLIENRQKLAGTYDAYLPGSGLLIWHIDETMPDNNTAIPAADPAKHADCTWPNHYHVALQQADGYMNLENNVNDGDIADPYPGSFGITAFSPTSTGDFPTRTPPNSGSYADCGSLVAVRNILEIGDDIHLDLEVIGAPTGSILINNGNASTNTTAVTLNLSATDPGGSGLLSMRFRNTTEEPYSGWEPYMDTRAWTLKSGTGTRRVYAQFMDGEGNLSDANPVNAGAQGYVDEIGLYDTTRPTGWILINNGAASTGSTAVTLNLSAADTGGSSLTSMRFRNTTEVPYSDWEPYVDTRGWTLKSGTGTRRVYAQFMDGAGNVSDANPVSAGSQGYVDEIVLYDTTRPTGWILINNGAASTASTAVTLTLSATDTGGSGLTSMRFRNTTEVPYSDWEPYVDTRGWTLKSGTGTRRVYAQFMDRAGNVSDANPVNSGAQGYVDEIALNP